MEFDAGTWWLIGILLTFLIGALGWMVKRSLDKIERKLDSAATKTELEKEVGECKQQIAEIQHNYTTRDQHQQDWTECHNDIKAIQRNFLTKEDYFREQAKTDKNLIMSKHKEWEIETLSKGFSLDALSNILYLVNEERKKLSFYVGSTGVVENLLLGILEVKYKCQ